MWSYQTCTTLDSYWNFNTQQLYFMNLQHTSHPRSVDKKQYGSMLAKQKTSNNVVGQTIMRGQKHFPKMDISTIHKIDMNQSIVLLLMTFGTKNALHTSNNSSLLRIVFPRVCHSRSSQIHVNTRNLNNK